MEHTISIRQAPLKVLESLKQHLERFPSINTGKFKATIKIRGSQEYEIVVTDVMVFARVFYNHQNEATVYVRIMSVKTMTTHLQLFESEEPWTFIVIGVSQEHLLP